jgi:hypothetical protein
VLVLFIISVVCFFALIGAAVAMIRHVRTGNRQERSAAPPQPEFKQHLQSAVKYGSIRDLRQVHHQRVESITARKEWNAPSQTVEIHPSAEDQIASGRRKKPQAASVGRRQVSSDRVDWTHFNKDYGDLTDPHPSRPVRAASDRAASRSRY